MRVKCGLAAASVGSLVIVAGCSSESTDAKALALQECKDSVQSQLAYPNDADFPFFDPVPVDDGHGGWQVSGSVTAKNGFGGSHKLRWTCSVDSAGDVNAHIIG